MLGSWLLGLGVSSLGFEVQGHSIDAVAQASRRRSIGKYVTEMTSAIAAVHFGACHAVAAIDGRADAALDGREEAGPARAALELAIGELWNVGTSELRNYLLARRPRLR